MSLITLINIDELLNENEELNEGSIICDGSAHEIHSDGVVDEDAMQSLGHLIAEQAGVDDAGTGTAIEPDDDSNGDTDDSENEGSEACTAQVIDIQWESSVNMNADLQVCTETGCTFSSQFLQLKDMLKRVGKKLTAKGAVSIPMYHFTVLQTTIYLLVQLSQ